MLSEVLTYHNQASQDELKELLVEGVPDASRNSDISSQMYSLENCAFNDD